LGLDEVPGQRPGNCLYLPSGTVSEYAQQSLGVVQITRPDRKRPASVFSNRSSNAFGQPLAVVRRGVRLLLVRRPEHALQARGPPRPATARTAPPRLGCRGGGRRRRRRSPHPQRESSASSGAPSPGTRSPVRPSPRARAAACSCSAGRRRTTGSNWRRRDRD